MDQQHMQDASARRSLIRTEGFRPFQQSWLELGIHRCFEAQAAHFQNRIAIANGSASLTYQALNLAANRLAHRLLEVLDSRNNESVPIALLASQGPGAVTAVLAVLKAGQILAPLDQRMPGATLSGVLDRLMPAVVLVDADCELILTNLCANRYPVIRLESSDPHAADSNPECFVRADATACIYFTSGSTGVPKGVEDSHRNVMHNIMRYTNSLGFAADDRMSLVQNPSFSGTMSTMFGALLNGASLVPRNLYSTRAAPLELSLGDWLELEEVTVFHAVPSIFRSVLKSADRYPAMRLIRLEGDRSTRADVEHFYRTFNERCVLVNGLGATECGLVCQYFIDRHSSKSIDYVLPVGYPVEETVVRIVDDTGQPVAPDEQGEIIIESEWLARGYWRDPTLTDKRFSIDGSGRRRYRTGDLGRLAPDGCLTLLGRSDTLVRVRGQFVDTAHIEAVLTRFNGVHHSIVRPAKGGQGEDSLTAWVVTDAGVSPTSMDLRLNAHNELPAHAVPANFVFLDALPLTADGKLDLRQLPAPGRQRPQLGTRYATPITNLHQQIVRVWCKVLDIDRIGIDDTFIELGGDSLQAIRIAEQLSVSLHVSLSVLNLFEQPTIRTLAAGIEAIESVHTGQSRQAPHVHQAGQAQQANETRGTMEPVAQSDATPTDSDWPEHAIAIIGMACRFPGAVSVAEFWDNLRNSRESITRFDAPQTGDAGYEDAWTRAYGLLDDIDLFDADFFGLTPREARDLDPQQRIWLECVLHALEDAGRVTNGSTVRSSFKQATDENIGVFAGARESTYLREIISAGNPLESHHISNDAMGPLKLGNERDTLALRTSFLFDFTGPSITVQSTCSTSLVAVAQACQSLAAGQCDTAIAGGSCITFPQLRASDSTHRGIRARDGYCRTFDAAASGTVFGDGVGVVVLKRVSDALADGDRIDALIRGWAINNDGAQKASFAAPNANAQTQVVMRAQRHAGVHPRSIGYIETHGTATPVGDPIEVAALQRAFAEAAESPGTCGIGSVKGNVGHLDVAAGVAGLIKTALALRHGEIPASLHFKTPNPAIEFDNTRLRVIDRLEPWPALDGPRIAGVSSFGVGGTNCHVVLQHIVTGASATGIAQDAGKGARRAQPANIGFLFTGQGCLYPGMAKKLFDTEPVFRRVLQAAETLLLDKLDVPLLEVVFDAHDKHALLERADYAHVTLFTIQYALCQLLEAWGIRPTLVLGHSLGEVAAACVAGVLSFNDALALSLGRGLLFRDLDSTGAMLVVIAGRDTVEQLLEAHIDTCSIAAVNAPMACVISGAVPAVEAIERVCSQRRLPTHRLNIALAYHSPLIEPVLEPLEKLAASLHFQEPSLAYISGCTGTRLAADVAKPDYWVRHARQTVEFRKALETLNDCGCNTVVEIGPDPRLLRWIREALGNAPETTVTATLRRLSDDNVAMDETATQLSTAGVEIDAHIVRGDRLHLSGYRSQEDQRQPLGRMSLYAFERRRHWHESLVETAASARVQLRSDVRHLTPDNSLAGPQGTRSEDRPVIQVGSLSDEKPEELTADPLLGRRIQLPGSRELRFCVRYSPDEPAYLNDHRLFGIPVAPGASHFAMLAQAAPLLANGKPVDFEELYLIRALTFADNSGRDLQLVFVPDAAGWRLHLFSTRICGQEWIEHMVGRAVSRSVAEETKEPNHAATQAADLRIGSTKFVQSFVDNADSFITGEDFYARQWANQGGTGMAFRWLECAWRRGREALCTIRRPATVGDSPGMRLHPGVLEAACQVLHCCGTIETPEEMAKSGITYVPFAVQRLSVYPFANDEQAAWCHAILRKLDTDEVIGDLRILSMRGTIMASINGFRLRRVYREQIETQDKGVVRHRDGSAAIEQNSYLTAISDSIEPDDVLLLAPESKTGDVLGGTAGREAGSNTDGDSAKNVHGATDRIWHSLHRHCVQLLGHDGNLITPDTNPLDIGFDSMTALLLSNRIRQDFGVSVDMAIVLAAVSLNEVMDAIVTAIDA